MSDLHAPNDPCARCGYALHGIADDAACPECGLLAERSRQRSDHLADATQRVLHPGLAEHAAIVGVGLAVAVLTVPLVAFRRACCGAQGK